MTGEMIADTGPLRPPEVDPIRLIPLNCVRCATPVPAEAEEIGWVCSHCGQGLILDEAQGLAPLGVQYSSAIKPAQHGQPFWAVRGRMTLDRDTYGRGQDRAAREFWGQPRTFFIPAVEMPLDELLALGKQLLRNPPVLEPGPAVPFPPITVPAEDVPALAEFLVVAVEAERKDRLKEIRFQLALDGPELWVLPGAEKAG